MDEQIRQAEHEGDPEKLRRELCRSGQHEPATAKTRVKVDHPSWKGYPVPFEITVGVCIHCGEAQLLNAEGRLPTAEDIARRASILKKMRQLKRNSRSARRLERQPEEDDNAIWFGGGIRIEKRTVYKGYS